MFSQLSLWINPLLLYHYSAVRSAPNYLMEFMVGKMLQDQGDLQQAALWYLRSIESRPVYALSHYNLATILVKAGQLEAAVGEFRAAYQRDPNNESIRAGLQWAEAELAKQRAGQPN
jgi:tetratricopeptide (TPR) repeat protein